MVDGKIVDMKERLVSEPISPVPGTMDTNRMAAGLPGLPSAFVWGDETVHIKRVIREWHDTRACDHGSSDRYLNKHWFEIEDDAGRTMKLYFERNPRSRGQRTSRQRWRLFSVREG